MVLRFCRLGIGGLSFARCCWRRSASAYLLNFLGYLRERLRWSLLWSVVLLISLTGLLYIMDNGGWLRKFA